MGRGGLGPEVDDQGSEGLALAADAGLEGGGAGHVFDEAAEVGGDGELGAGGMEPGVVGFDEGSDGMSFGGGGVGELGEDVGRAGQQGVHHRTVSYSRRQMQGESGSGRGAARGVGIYGRSCRMEGRRILGAYEQVSTIAAAIVAARGGEGSGGGAEEAEGAGDAADTESACAF